MAFEASHRVKLPEPYRTFVVSVANGAIGPPHYGLVGFGEPAWEGAGQRLTAESLQRPFPLTVAWLWDGNEDDSDEDVLTRIEEVHRAGTLPLGTDGDGMDYALIVTGASRGEVWMLSGEFALPVARDFGDWIRRKYLPDAKWLLDNRPVVPEMC